MEKLIALSNRFEPQPLEYLGIALTTRPTCHYITERVHYYT